jgi:hypothetical protein
LHKTLAVIAVAMLAGCPKKAPAPAKSSEPVDDPDAEVVAHTWQVMEHLRVKGASIAEADANGFHGRTLVIVQNGFASPWQAGCEHAKREKRSREINELFDELEIEKGGSSKAAAFGMTSDILEFRLTCADRGTPLIIWVGGSHAMTCFSGACYLLKRFED